MILIMKHNCFKNIFKKKEFKPSQAKVNKHFSNLFRIINSIIRELFELALY